MQKRDDIRILNHSRHTRRKRVSEKPLSVERVMKLVPYTLKPSDSLAHVEALFQERSLRHLPILEDGRLVGMVSARDLRHHSFIAAGFDSGEGEEGEDRGPDRTPVSEVMSTDVETVSPADTLEQAAELMQREHVGALPVVEDDRLVGIVSCSDVLDQLAQERTGSETKAPAKRHV